MIDIHNCARRYILVVGITHTKHWFSILYGDGGVPLGGFDLFREIF